jgi:hypothetical protein
MNSRDYAETVGHILTGTCSVQRARTRRLIAIPLVRTYVEPPPESNRRPHPCNESRAHRSADQRFCRSLATVSGEVMCSTRMLVHIGPAGVSRINQGASHRRRSACGSGCELSRCGFLVGSREGGEQLVGDLIDNVALAERFADCRFHGRQ